MVTKENEEINEIQIKITGENVIRMKKYRHASKRYKLRPIERENEMDEGTINEGGTKERKKRNIIHEFTSS
jgi:hypothetical protein